MKSSNRKFKVSIFKKLDMVSIQDYKTSKGCDFYLLDDGSLNEVDWECGRGLINGSRNKVKNAARNAAEFFSKFLVENVNRGTFIELSDSYFTISIMVSR